MAGGKRLSAGEQAKKKKRASKAEKEEEEKEEEKEGETQTGSKRSERTLSAAQSEKPTVVATASSTKAKNESSSDALQSLKDKFNALHELRFTEPEKQCLELKKLIDERKSASDSLIKKLESRVADLEQQTKSLVEVKKKEKELLEQVATARGENEKLRKSLDLADQERIALTKALETTGDSDQNMAATQRLVSILDTFKSITGVTLKLDEGDSRKGTCTVYNTSTRKGVKLNIAIGSDSFTFAPVANKQYLPVDMRETSKTTREEAPRYLARITEALFL
jgi:hypothetical protein